MMKKRTKNVLRISAIACGLLFALSSCKNNKVEEAPSTEKITTTTEEITTDLNDAQIVSIILTASQVDVDWAKIAERKTSVADVKVYAETIIKDHQSVIDELTSLTEDLKITPEENPTSQSLIDTEKSKLEELNGKYGDNFNKAYTDNEVAFHESLVKTLEETLISTAKNNELKNLLNSALLLYKSHLEEAREMQNMLGK